MEGAPPLALLSESVTGDGADGDVHESAGSGGMSPSFIRFFCFIRLFWNQILTCVSLSWRAAAISIRRARVRYLLKWNSFSNSVSCLVVKLVRPVLLAPPRPPPPLPTPPPPPPGLPTPPPPRPPKPPAKPPPIPPPSPPTPLPQLGLLPPKPYSGRGAAFVSLRARPTEKIKREKEKQTNQSMERSARSSAVSNDYETYPVSKLTYIIQRRLYNRIEASGVITRVINDSFVIEESSTSDFVVIERRRNQFL